MDVKHLPIQGLRFKSSHQKTSNYEKVAFGRFFFDALR